MHYKYSCFNCKKEYSATEIEKENFYLCPNCGSANKNEPLNGVLKVDYDFDFLKSKLTRNDFLNCEPGAFWDYPLLWPLDSASFEKKSQLEKLRLSNNPVQKYQLNNKDILIFDDTRNPTFSYKDRATSLVAMKALELGISQITMASTGNAGSSLAGICARLGLQSHIFVPKNIPQAKRLQIQSYGAQIYLVDGDYDAAFDLNLEVTQNKGWYSRNTAYNPLTIEGKKSGAFDIFLALKGNLPDFIFIPAGDGVILSGIYKGFEDLKNLGWIEKIPQLVAVQADGSDALVRFIENGKFNYKPASTMADSIHAGAPRNLFMAASAIKESGGKALRVSDKAISEAQKIAAQQLGILIEPAAAASLAGLLKLTGDEYIREKKCMLLFTGNGLKDVQSLQNWNLNPEAKPTLEWKKILMG
ncbi:MAG: pyridoxal-phosphate dependent enzyme [Calditrichaeota bacterium]|nr:MAG: pyridoxal-phosphate dependent enzyme [Calditrichota bacterium]MBL1204724.1 pyridoxal-phosphate dependent enzyme [Calditrichota bacterium]NOG44552.1 pyridoxal-phosphate dependent enzyme [Calditrichota bacterium]